MLRPLVRALAVALVVSAALTFGLARGTGVLLLSGWMAWPVAAAASVLVALVAGRPVWAKEARVEALLKAVAAALLGLGALWAARRWLPGVTADLGWAGLGRGVLAELPAVVLPVVTLPLALLFELDHAVGGAEPAARRRAPPEPARLRAAAEEEDEEARAVESGRASRHQRGR